MLGQMALSTTEQGHSQLPKKSSAALAEAFDLHGPFLLRVVERKIGAGPHVEDVVQEVFIIAFQKWNEIGSYEYLKTWLYRVAMNKCMHAKRSYARRGRLADHFDQHQHVHEEHIAQPEAEARVHQRDQARLVRMAIEKLSDSVRDIFVLYELEGVAGKEIAEMLDMPLNTIWSRLRKARGEFKSAWLKLENEMNTKEAQ